MSSSPSPSGLGRFVGELRRRHVVRVSLAYGAVGFVLLQAAEIVLPAFLPGFEADAALRVLVVAFLLLFPVVVALAWVYEITPQGIRAMEALDAEAGRPPSGRVVPRVAFLVLTVAAAGSAGLWWYRTDTAALAAAEARRAARSTPFVPASTDDASGPIRSLAVLPLEDFSAAGDDGQAYFAAGMHEALISQLSQLGTVRVISRTSTEGYRTEGKSLPQIGADLGVDAVVEGSVLRADGRVRITVQLVHAASDSHLWARDYERSFEDVITLQREVATAIAAEIESRLEGPPGSRSAEAVDAADDAVGPADRPASTAAVTMEAPAAPAAPVAPEVQDAVLRGRFALRSAGEEQVAEAERFFVEALTLDSTFVPALTGLAGAHLVRGLEGPGPEALRELVGARKLALEAVRRDSASVEAREVLAATEEALSEFGTRLGGEGGQVGEDAWLMHMADDSMVVVMAGDTARIRVGEPFASATEMGRFIQVAMAQDPSGSRSAGDELRAIVRLEAGGRTTTALARARAALERFPDQPFLWDVAERLSVGVGDLDGVVEMRRERAAEEGAPAGAAIDALADRVEEEGAMGYWTWKLDEFDAREAAGERVSPVDQAAAHASLGHSAEALDLLETARAQRDPRLLSLRADPVWDPLRPEPRFQALLRSLGPASRTSREGGRR